MGNACLCQLMSIIRNGCIIDYLERILISYNDNKKVN